MLTCFFTEKKAKIIPIYVVALKNFNTWILEQPERIKAWLSSTQFKLENVRVETGNNVRIIPDAEGNIAAVLCCVSDRLNLWDVGFLPYTLPEGDYQLQVSDEDLAHYGIGWGLGAYQFTRYKNATRNPATLFLPAQLAPHIEDQVTSIYLVRDLINTPTDDMGPTQLAESAEKLALQYGASFTQIVGEELLAQNYPCIYTVGRASDDPPRLLDLRYGDKTYPKITLVGKGVCFDSGGLDLKPAPHMLLMKKDMAGGAHVLGLARMIMEAELPVNLRVLIPAVENVISGNAYRPGDIIKSRKGLTIEIGNTDAEGRVVLADALTEAVSENPDLLIDITTLTGAARVALGPDVPAVFSNNDALVEDMCKRSHIINDPMWRLPLVNMYREYLNTPIADINNASLEPYAGAITAALFLKEFVPDTIRWLHFDMMAWNIRPRAGRPVGGEAQALRALFGYLLSIYQK